MYAYEMQKSLQSLSLTIITCAMKFHEPFLVANYIGLRNFSKSIRWIIVNNDDSALDLPREIQNDTKVEIQKGPPLDTSYGPISIGVHHAKALEMATRQVLTSNVLILDPDFVILKWDLIMKHFTNLSTGKTFLVGTPWFPTWYRKIVFSLAPHLVFVKKNILNSGFEWYPINQIPRNLKSIDPDLSRARSDRSIFKFKIFRFLLQFFYNRTKINSEYDTFGSSERLASHGHVSFLEPQLTKNQLARISPTLRYSLGRRFERLVPFKFRYLPHSYSVAPFELSASTQHIEHWSVAGEIFGVHMRSFGAGKLNSKDLNAIREFSEHVKYLTEERVSLF
jgi:hypothetical protein